MFDKFLDLLAESVIFQGLITLLVIGAWIYMMVAGLPVPPELQGAALLIIGFFFGGKFVQATAKMGVKK